MEGRNSHGCSELRQSSKLSRNKGVLPTRYQTNCARTESRSNMVAFNALRTPPNACKHPDENGCHSTNMAASREQTRGSNKNGNSTKEKCQTGFNRNLTLIPTDVFSATKKFRRNQFATANKNSLHPKNYMGTPFMLKSNGNEGSHCYRSRYVKNSNSSRCSRKNMEVTIPLNSRKSKDQDVPVHNTLKQLHKNSIEKDVRSNLGDVLLQTCNDAFSKLSSDSFSFSKCNATQSERCCRTHEPLSGTNYHSSWGWNNCSGNNVPLSFRREVPGSLYLHMSTDRRGYAYRPNIHQVSNHRVCHRGCYETCTKIPSVPPITEIDEWQQDGIPHLAGSLPAITYQNQDNQLDPHYHNGHILKLHQSYMDMVNSGVRDITSINFYFLVLLLFHLEREEPLANFHSEGTPESHRTYQNFNSPIDQNTGISATNYGYVDNGISPLQRTEHCLCPYWPTVAFDCHSVQPNLQYFYQNVYSGVQTHPHCSCGFEQGYASYPQMVLSRYMAPVNPNPCLILPPISPVIERKFFKARLTKRVVEETEENMKLRCPEKKMVENMKVKSSSTSGNGVSCDQRSTVRHQQ